MDLIPCLMTAEKDAEVENQIISVFDEQEVPFATLNRSLHRLADILEQPRVGKESIPAIKLKKEHVEFLVIYYISWFLL